MKKTIIILLASFYLIIASGLTVSAHYCGGKFKSLSVLNIHDEKGCCGNKKKSKDCCKDKTAFIKVKDNHQSNILLKAPFNGFKTIDIALPQLSLNLFINQCEIITQNYHAPPVFYDNPLYLKHRVLLI
jgi:hypothetical protein